jgi:hypothetical protein
MLIETDQAPEDVQLAVLASLSDRYTIVNNSVGAVGGEDDPDPSVDFVICPVRGLIGTFVDQPDRAADLAKREGAVIVEWTADHDHRGEVTV